MEYRIAVTRQCPETNGATTREHVGATGNTIFSRVMLRFLPPQLVVLRLGLWHGRAAQAFESNVGLTDGMAVLWTSRTRSRTTRLRLQLTTRTRLHVTRLPNRPALPRAYGSSRQNSSRLQISPAAELSPICVTRFPVKPPPRRQLQKH